MRRILVTLVAILAAAAALTACSGSAKAGTCLSSLQAVTSTAATSPALPALKLGCLDGTGDVAIPKIATPMIISFWAEYCQPCRTELPALEKFADAAGARLTVIGVDTADVQAMGRSMASDMSLTFPMLSDPDSVYFKAVAAPGLPTLLFVTPGGHIATMLSSGDVTEATLAQTTTKYLGVTVE